MNKDHFELLDKYAKGEGIDLEHMNSQDIKDFSDFVCEHLNTKEIKRILSYIIHTILDWNV